MKSVALLLTVLLFGGCAGVIPEEVSMDSLDADRAYIRQFSEKESSREFLVCHARYAEKDSSRLLLPRVKLDGVIHDLAPASARQIIVQIVFSSTSLLRAAGDVSFAMPVRLEAGRFYEFDCRREGDTFFVSLKNQKTDAFASPKFQFDAKNPVIIPIPI